MLALTVTVSMSHRVLQVLKYCSKYVESILNVFKITVTLVVNQAATIQFSGLLKGSWK